MICKCGADMRHQSQGVWFCSRGDRFAVVIGQQAQWFSAEGEPEPYLADTEKRVASNWRVMQGGR